MLLEAERRYEDRQTLRIITNDAGTVRTHLLRAGILT